MQYITESPLMLGLWIVLVAWLAAGFGEELLWRGFLLDRLMRLPGISGRIWLAIVIQAVLFGLPHLYQGWGGVIVTGSIGLLLGWLRIKAEPVAAGLRPRCGRYDHDGPRLCRLLGWIEAD